MPIVPLFGVGQQGKSPTVSAQRHLNLYAEITPEGEKSHVSFHGTPGLRLFTAFGETPVRGYIVVGSLIYCVHRNTLYSVNNAGARIALETIGTTAGRVQFAYNGTQIAIVDGTNYYVYTVATDTLNTITTNLIATPIDVTFQDGYGILTFADGRFQITSAYDFKTLDALDFATAESNPDGLVRGIADHGEVVLCGDLTVEFWGNSGAADFPYSNIRGATLEFGLAAAYSLTKFNDSLAGLFKNRMGQVQVMIMRGHALEKISTQELDSIINGYSSVSDATGYSYMLGGHPMYQINFPAAGKSWLYDASTQLWSPLESGLSGARHRGEMEISFVDHILVTDYENGNVYILDPETYTDNGAPIPREIITRHFNQAFKPVSVFALQVDFETGVGLVSGQGADPQAMLQVSKDNGHTWGIERWTSMGAIGEYQKRVIWRRLGMARDWLFKIRVSDPVKVVITSGSIDARAGR
jgi:hypothetical protein